MDDGYEAFVMADPVFYDVPHSGPGGGDAFRIADRPLPDGWRRTAQDDWFVFTPGRASLPEQGWKIHVSACLDNADRILESVWDYCLPRGIELKFLRSPAALRARVSKYARRGYSGKLVTIYPADDAACQTILTELGEILDGEPNPYILSDLRWGAGPLHVRYGAFVNRYTVDVRGEVVPAIANPDGELVPDQRGPVFSPPAWVSLPDFLAPHLAARNAVKVDAIPYTVARVLHFSNGGGIYVARDNRTGEQVVLKEGRPHAGLDARGHDAVRRLEREYEILRRLAGIPGVPAAHDLFWLGEHRFLAMEYVEGTVLSQAIVRGYPLIDPSAGAEEYARFTDWAVDVFRQVEATVAAMHERGVVYGDMHLFNIMVREDAAGRPRTTLLDFEVAAPVEEGVRPGLGNQGFAAPRGTTGFDIDQYGLACLRLALFLPMTNLLGLHRPKAHHFREIIAEHFGEACEPKRDASGEAREPKRDASGEAREPKRDASGVGDSYLDRAVEVIAPGEPEEPPRIEPDPRRWPGLRDRLVRAIVASATPDRDDRLFPGDVQQFAVGGLGLAYGAAGVLYALSVTGAGRHPELEEWLLRHATTPPGGTRPGLYDGLHGVGFVLDHLGHRQQALDTIDICLREDWESLGLDLGGGLAGIGLNLLHLADRTGEPALRVAAHRAAELVAGRIGDDPVPAGPAEQAEPAEPGISGREQGYAGLMRGRAGAALLLMRAYDDTGDAGYLDRAAVALRQDLRTCLVRDNGTLEVNEGWRTMPYLEVGSVGIGMVLDAYLARRHDVQFAQASQRVAAAAQAEMYILPGLFSGRAGILLYLAGRSPEPAADPAVARQVRNLAWHALPYADGLAFPGNGLQRLSMDLASGGAGVLLALGAVLHDAPVHAPLLQPAIGPAVHTRTPAPTGAGP